MFSRRLLALVLTTIVVTVVFGAQLAWLTIAQASTRREKAERVLTSVLPTPTVRGRILDCKDRTLGADRAGYDAAVHYSVITGDWAYDRARRKAKFRQQDGWSDLTEEQRLELVAREEVTYDRQIENLWHTLCGLGNIELDQLHEQRADVIQRVQQMASHLHVIWQRREEELTGEKVELREVARRPIIEQTIDHPILVNVSQSARVRVEQMIAEAGPDSVWYKVSISDSRRREYPLEQMDVEIDLATFPGPLKRDEKVTVKVEGVALHTLGAMRKVWKQDVKDRPFAADGRIVDLGGYRPGDRRGSWGIEKSQESRLRGKRGKRVRDNITGRTTETIDPQAGRDVMISLDINLQARLEGLMSHDPRLGLMLRQPWHNSGRPDSEMGTPLNGAAMVMDVATGQIRAAVSVPSISRRLLREEYDRLHKDAVNMPLMNRAVGANYLPGSTVKPAVLCAAVTDRKLSYGGTVHCDGMMNPKQPNKMRCWIYKLFNHRHYDLAGPQAIKHSCNIFFFTMGSRLRGPGLVRWYDRLGLGRVTDCGLAEEAVGVLPDVRRIGEPNAPGLTRKEAMLMAIGQGPINWTVVQACKLYGTIARSGSVVHPTFLGPGAEPVDPPMQTWTFDPRGAEMALEGLYLAANEKGGTVNALSHELVRGEAIFSILDDLPELRIMAKSGTADTATTWFDEDGDRERDQEEYRKRGDHAWTICLVQRPSSPRPDFVIAVVVEFGGSGSHVAGPIANQILINMLAEGYL